MKTNAQLCPVVEGVMFTTLYRGRCVRGLVLRDALEQWFGADEDPQSWLQAFHAHQDRIAGRACDLWAEAPDQRMVLLRWRHFESGWEPSSACATALWDDRVR